MGTQSAARTVQKAGPLRASEEILTSDTHGTISISEAGILQHLEEKERHQSVSLNVKLTTCVCSGGPAVCQRGLSPRGWDGSRHEGREVHGNPGGPGTTACDRINGFTISIEPSKSKKDF